MIARLSRKLADKIKGTELTAAPPADDPLTDWSAHLFVASRTQYIIISNTTCLYSTVFFGRGVTDDHELIVTALRSIADTLETDGLREAYTQRVAPGSGTVIFAKALSRQVTGSMNDLIGLAKYMLIDGNTAPEDLAPRLNDNFLSVLKGRDGSPYGRPMDALRALIEE